MATKVSLGFGKLPDFSLDNFAKNVIEKLTGNAAFPTLPVTLANLEAAQDDFATKTSIAQAGTPFDTAAKNNSRQTLLGMLRQVASYVQIKCNDDLAVLLSSGFEAQSSNRTSVQLEKPTGLSMKNGDGGELVAKINPVKKHKHVRRPDQTSDRRLVAERLHRRFATCHFRRTNAGTDLHGPSARSRRIDRPIGLERPQFAHGDLANTGWQVGNRPTVSEGSGALALQTEHWSRSSVTFVIGWFFSQRIWPAEKAARWGWDGLAAHF